MARDALAAKQQTAEVLLREVDQLKKSVDGDTLLQRAHRAEVDSRLLLEELQGLMQAKADVAQQRADLDRVNALLMAERELLCEQLDVSSHNMNLCQAVQKVLAAAKRAQGLEAQLRMLARCQRDLLLQLEATREQEARAARHWQVCEQVYIDTLAAHGIQQPEVPLLLLQQHSSGTSRCSSNAQNNYTGGAGLAGSSCQPHSLMSAHTLSRLNSGPSGTAAAGLCASSERHLSAGLDGIIGSPASHTHLLPATPPASDMSLFGGPQQLRRSHSLDSCLHSLTGLLDQLALGQLGSEDLADCDYDECYERDFGDADHWMLVDTMSDETAPGGSTARDQASDPGSGAIVGSVGLGPSSAGAHAAAVQNNSASAAGDGNAAAAAPGLLMLGAAGSTSSHGHAQLFHHKYQVLQQQQQLQTVEEVQEDQDSTERVAAA